jgi:hypothetical protein
MGPETAACGETHHNWKFVVRDPQIVRNGKKGNIYMAQSLLVLRKIREK